MYQRRSSKYGMRHHVNEERTGATVVAQAQRQPKRKPAYESMPEWIAMNECGKRIHEQRFVKHEPVTEEMRQEYKRLYDAYVTVRGWK